MVNSYIPRYGTFMCRATTFQYLWRLFSNNLKIFMGILRFWVTIVKSNAQKLHLGHKCFPIKHFGKFRDIVLVFFDNFGSEF